MAASPGGAAGTDHVSSDSWKKGGWQPALPLLVASSQLVDSSGGGGSAVVTPDLRNLSEMGFALCDYQDENGESEAMRAEYYAITRVRSAKRRVTVGPGDRGGRGKSSVLFRDCQRVIERQAALHPASAR